MYTLMYMHISQSSTKVFLDSGDPQHTIDVLQTLGFLHGQTTNPSLVAKSDVITKLADGNTLSTEQLLDGYRTIVNRIYEQIPEGSISIEVYADATTTTQDMVDQAQMLREWLPDPHIKLPINAAGLAAATQLVADGAKVNMTLCFTQEQALAVHMATQGAAPGQVFVSPFIGRLDDIGVCGVSLIENIVRMYRELESPVEVLAASIRTLEHIPACVHAGADILTIPYKLFEPWSGQDFSVDESPHEHAVCGLETIAFKSLDATNWHDLDIQHDLTDAGLQRFADDWNALIT